MILAVVLLAQEFVEDRQFGWKESFVRVARFDGGG